MTSVLLGSGSHPDENRGVTNQRHFPYIEVQPGRFD